MAITLDPKLEACLQRLVESGRFRSLEHFIAYALGAYPAQEALLEDAGFRKRVETALAEAQDDLDAGRVRTFTKENHHELYDEVVRRGEERLGRDRRE